ncbi:MAG: TonB-dependent receptor [Proteobacteria bacterium]|uniref:TonB-dependent receptor n=1 Tax=Rudaea sp. TaxID=2136325 RepID=UPI0037844270|nr:TonB-dependent receptor [Pseudomonadota bacterium]
MPQYVERAAAPSIRRTVLSRALAISLACVVSEVVAQDTTQQARSAETTAPPETAGTHTSAAADKDKSTSMETITVTGIRSSIQSSIENKRNDTVISDVLSAKDVGDLPALSIGDAIQTITGVSSHRENNGATELFVRGLGPFLTASSFNGREISNGSGNRSVNFDKFPAEMVNTVRVYKTQRADLIEGGVAGTVELETLKPLDFGKQRLQFQALSIYAGYQNRRNDDSPYYGSGTPGWRGTASYVDQFHLGEAGDLGLALSLQNNGGTNPDDLISSSSTWNACNAAIKSSATSNCTAVTPQQANSGTPYYLVPNSRQYRQLVDKRQMNTFTGALQWRLNDRFEANLDWQVSHPRTDESRADLNFTEARRGLTSLQYDPNGVLRSAAGNSTIQANPTYYTRDERYSGGGLKLRWRPSDSFTIDNDFAYSRDYRQDTTRSITLLSNAKDINGNPVAGVINGQRVNYTYAYNGADAPTIVVDPRFDLGNADNFAGPINITRTDNPRHNIIRAWRLDTNYTPAGGPFTALKFGVRLSKSIYTQQSEKIPFNYTDAATIRAANLACREDFRQTDFFAGYSGNAITSWATFDPLCIYKALTGVYDTGRVPGGFDPMATTDVRERTNAAYLMGEFSSELFGLPVTGNVGVRLVQTSDRSIGGRTGLNVINNPDGTISLQPSGQVTQQTFNASSTEPLPSLNVAFDLAEDKLFRFGLYRAMSRTDWSNLGAGRVFTVDPTNSFPSLQDALKNVTANGNPAIKPLMSWNADFSFEWYPNPDSMLSAALYYKQFNGGYRSSVSNETYVINGTPVTVPVVVMDTTNKKSDLTGIELSAVHRLSYLPHPFDGLAFKLGYNYALTDFKTEDLRLGELVNPVTGAVTPRIVEPASVFGYSKTVYSASLIYTLKRLEMQAIYNYRSQYYEKFVAGPSQNRYVGNTGVLDFRMTYKVNDALSFSLQGSNLNGYLKRSYMPIPGSFYEDAAFGPRYYLGIKYQFK